MLMTMAKATVILFKRRGKYYTQEEWEIPEGAQGPYDMVRSPDFRRIDDGAVLVPDQEPWGYPHLLPTPTYVIQRLTEDGDWEDAGEHFHLKAAKAHMRQILISVGGRNARIWAARASNYRIMKFPDFELMWRGKDEPVPPTPERSPLHSSPEHRFTY
jgi:hypothetical protein